MLHLIVLQPVKNIITNFATDATFYNSVNSNKSVVIRTFCNIWQLSITKLCYSTNIKTFVKWQCIVNKINIICIVWMNICANTCIIWQVFFVYLVYWIIATAIKLLCLIPCHIWIAKPCKYLDKLQFCNSINSFPFKLRVISCVLVQNIMIAWNYKNLKIIFSVIPYFVLQATQSICNFNKSNSLAITAQVSCHNKVIRLFCCNFFKQFFYNSTAFHKKFAFKSAFFKHSTF